MYVMMFVRHSYHSAEHPRKAINKELGKKSSFREGYGYCAVYETWGQLLNNGSKNKN